MNRTTKISFSSLMTAAAVALRVGKNWGLGPIQFINLPLVFGYTASRLAGPRSGLFVGSVSQFLSDLLIFPGPWTIVTSASSGLFSAISGFIRDGDATTTAILLFLLTLCYDVVTSVLGYMVIGYTLVEALVVGLAGLFMPAGGGWLIGVGPTTEAATALVSVSLIKALGRSGVIDGR